MSATASPESNISRPDNAVPLFFAVSIPKLLAMYVFTFTFYHYYWCYKNWILIRAHTGRRISPFWRTVFAIVFCYSLFNAIRQSQQRTFGTGTLAAGLLAFGWITSRVLWYLPDPYPLAVFFLSGLLLVPVQVVVNRINLANAPGHERNARLGLLHWITIIAVGSIYLLALVGSFLPADQEA